MQSLFAPVPTVLFAAILWLLVAIWALGGFAAAVLFAVVLDYVLQRIARTESTLDNQSGGKG